jgi:ATP/maltotriose-dependent transcriptional regulator MalT
VSMIDGTLANVRGGRQQSTAFVGRTGALSELAEAFAGQAVAVLVGGEAGIGKSRLVREFLDGITDARVLIGGCLELGEDAPSYAPFTAALRTLVRQLGVAGVADLLPPAGVGELARLLPEFGAPPADIEGARGRLFETILGLFERLARARPLVVVIEDVHWADRSTRELLTFLVHNLATEQVLFVITHRELPAAHPLRPVLVDLARRDRVMRMVLPRFTRAEVAAQVAGILGREPEPDVLDTIFTRSGGNPLFVEVLLIGDHLDAGLAPELRDLLMVAVERLPEPTQRALRVVAVGGTEVGHRLLLEVSELTDATLEDALRPAVRQRVLVTADDGYAFRHELIREVVYEGLLPGERVRLHRRYAESGDADPVSLAHHWFAAGDPERAFVASWQAARRAEVMAAHAERLRMLDRVLALWSHVDDPAGRIGADRADVLRQAVDAADECGELERGVELADQAVEAADPERDRIGAAQAYFCRAVARFRLGRPGTGEDLHLSMRLADDGPETADRARLLARLAHRMWAENDLARVRPLAEQSMLLAKRLGDEHAHALALGPLAALWVDAGEVDAARRAYAEIRAISARIGVPSLGVCADINESHILEGLGRHEAAAAAASSGLATAREFGLSRTFGGRLAGNLAEALFSLGRWDEALEAIDQVEVLTPPPAFLAPMLAWRGQILLARGDTEGAAAQVAEVKRLLPNGFDTAEDHFMHAWLAAKVLFVQASPDGAMTVIDRALDEWSPDRMDRYTWPLLVTGARALSDSALLRRMQPARAFAARLAKIAAATPARTPVELAHRAAFAASLSGSGWDAARIAWEATDQPYPLAWALLHAAEEAVAARDRATATEHIRHCVSVAQSLSATPVLRQAEAMAKRARLPLTDTAAPATPADPLGLTPRERDVLRLLASGESNRRIAAHLYISDKTVGVHVSHILTKLGVTNRGEAAAMTHRLGLFD